MSPLSARAGDYYVSTQGSDSNPGTSAQPFRTITRAYGLAVAGTTIIVEPGIYTDYSSNWGLRLGRSGTAASPITLKSKVRGGAVIEGQNAIDRNVGIYLDGSFNIVDGFEIRGGPYGGITIWGNYNQILNNKIHHNGNLASTSTLGQDGIYSCENTGNNIYMGNFIHDNGRTGSNFDHALYLCGDNEMVINNVLIRNAAYGLHIAGYTTVGNLKVYNNVIAHNGKSGIIFWMAVSGVDIKNNIIYQNGKYGIDSYDAHGSSVTIDRNLVFGNSLGDYALARDGSDFTYTQGATISVAPLFVNSTPAGFDAHLVAGSPAINAAMNLSSTFNTDLDGAARPASGGWDLGVYKYGNSDTMPPNVSLTGPGNNATISGPSVAISATASDDVGVVGVQFKLDGTNLGGEDTSAPYSASLNTTMLSNGTHTLSAVARDAAGNQTTATAVSVLVNNLASSSLTFAATSGTITAPFIATNGTISQPDYSSVTGGGRAAYGFTIANAGDYIVSALVNAPDDGANSLFVNIDGEPADPAMIWDIPLVGGLTQRTVAWRGNGTPESSEFAPKVFTLAAGTHTLIVRGREANCQVASFTIAPATTALVSNAPVVSLRKVSGNNMQITWTSTPGKVYRVACKPDLRAPNWTDLSGNITATATTTSWTHTPSAASKQCYYSVYATN